MTPVATKYRLATILRQMAGIILSLLKLMVVARSYAVFHDHSTYDQTRPSLLKAAQTLGWACCYSASVHHRLIVSDVACYELVYTLHTG